MGEYDKEPAKAAATAGPAEDDRYGAGILAKHLEARIIGAAVRGNKVAITIAAGSSRGVRVNMEGYIKAGVGMLAEFHIDEVKPDQAIALVSGIVLDQVQGGRLVCINPSSRPRVALDPNTRVIAVAVEEGRTRITIPRGKLHGIARGMTGELVSGDPHGRFVIDSVDTIRCYASVEQTTSYVTAHPNVLLHGATRRTP